MAIEIYLTEGQYKRLVLSNNFKWTRKGDILWLNPDTYIHIRDGLGPVLIIHVENYERLLRPEDY